MPPTVADSIARLEEAIPLNKAASWDAVGLQIGDRSAAADKVAVCHEVSSEVIDAALQADVELLVAYHPLLFRPTRTFVAGGSAPGRAFRLVSHGISLFVVHTAFDVAPDGCADALAQELGLTDVTGFGANWPADSAKAVTFAPQAVADGVAQAMATAGGGRIWKSAGEADPEAETRIEIQVALSRVDDVVAALVASHPDQEPAFDVYTTRANAGFIGRVGDLESEATLAAFSEHAGTVLSTGVRVAGDFGRIVRRVAVVPGSGSEFAAAAASAGADVLVTGDVSHHRGNEALESGMAVIDAGHAATERPGMERLYSLVSNMFKNVIDLTHIDPNPWGRA